MKQLITKRRMIVSGLAAATILLSASCTDDGSPAPEQAERDIKQQTYDRLTEQQPALGIEAYSPTRETINFWLETWGDQPGKLSYVYLMASNGQLVGYYVLQGLPVNYCAELTPPFDIRKGGGTGHTDLLVPMPAMDGVYYTGGACETYYGKDATSGSFIQYSVGNGMNHLLYEQPLPRQDVEPLGFTQIEDVNG